MTRIYDQQRHVVESFEEHLIYLHNLEQKSALKILPSDGMLEVLVDIKNLLKTQKNDEVLNNIAQQESADEEGQTKNASSPSKGSTGLDREDGDLTDMNSIPESTLHRAKQVVNSIMLRKGELNELEGSTVAIADQVSCFVLPYYRSQHFRHFGTQKTLTQLTVERPTESETTTSEYHRSEICSETRR